MMAVQPCVTTVLGPERWARGAGEGQAGWRGGWVRLGEGACRARRRDSSRVFEGERGGDARRERGRTGKALEFGEDEHHRRGADVTEVGVPELGEDPAATQITVPTRACAKESMSLESRAARGVDAPERVLGGDRYTGRACAHSDASREPSRRASSHVSSGARREVEAARSGAPMFRRTSGPEFNCMPDDEQEKSLAPGDERARGSQLETRAGRHSGVHTVARVHPSVIMTAPARVVPPTDKSAAVSARMMSSVRRCASQVRVRAAPRVTSRPLPSPTRLTRPVASLPLADGDVRRVRAGAHARRHQRRV